MLVDDDQTTTNVITTHSWSTTVDSMLNPTLGTNMTHPGNPLSRCLDEYRKWLLYVRGTHISRDRDVSHNKLPVLYSIVQYSTLQQSWWNKYILMQQPQKVQQIQSHYIAGRSINNPTITHFYSLYESSWHKNEPAVLDSVLGVFLLSFVFVVFPKWQMHLFLLSKSYIDMKSWRLSLAWTMIWHAK